MSAVLTEREITEPITLCLDNGLLNPQAVGFSRQPLHDTAGVDRARRGRGRTRRWERWIITSPTHIMTVSVTGSHHSQQHEVWVLDRDSGVTLESSAHGVLRGSLALPSSLGTGPIRVSTPHVAISIDEVSGGTRIRAWTKRVSLDVIAHRPSGHESLAVVVPRDSRFFQYTVADVARPAQGRVVIDGLGSEIAAGASFATLDHGRGRWPVEPAWSQASASGISEGHVLGLQFAGTDTAGGARSCTENALFIDGVLHKINAELTWDQAPTEPRAARHLSGTGVDLWFTPFHDRRSHSRGGGARSLSQLSCGHFSGSVTVASGTAIAVVELLGWAEHSATRS